MEPEPIFSVDEQRTKTVVCKRCGEEFGALVYGVLGVMDSFCPTCRKIIDDEWKAEEEARARAEEEAREAKQQADRIRRISHNLRNCSIGERFMGLVFDDYKPTCEKSKKVLEACQVYVDSFKCNSGASLLMIGSPGTGKNMLAAIICQELIKQDYMALHTTAMKLVRKVKDSWKAKRDSEQTEQDVIDSFVTPALLVIDEVGVQFGSTTEQLYLTEIINERYEKRRPTILISNLKLSQIAEVMGERVVDRFYDDGSKVLVFDWQSYRRMRMAA